jgi:putative ABC transport system permease protein
MTMWTRFRGATGPDPQRDVDEELSFHVEMLERDLIAAGESPERARERALKRFGDYDRSRVACLTIDERQGRRMARTQWIGELIQDVRYAGRALARRPGFTAVAVLTLALGIGANSAIFSVVHGVLLDSLPFAGADRLYVINMLYPDGTEYDALSAPDFMSVSADNRVFESVVAYTGGTLTLQGAGEAREVGGGYLSRGMMDALGLRLALGRGFASDEHVSGSGDVAVLSHAFWQRELGGSRDVVGRTMSLSGRAYTVVGVLHERSALPGDAAVYLPIEYDETFDATTATARRGEFLFTLGLARAGLTPAQVAADVQRVSVALAERFPDTNARLRMSITPLRDALTGEVRRPLFILLGAVGLVLLVACANVANLLLARGSARSGELSVRAALGAGRARLVRQLVTESLVLGLLGGIAGLALAWAGTRALIAMQPADIPRLDNIAVDGVVAGVTIAAALITALLFGIVPAIQATRAGLSQAIRAGGRGQSASGNRMRSALVVAEMALAVVLLAGAGLLIRSFVQLTRAETGFQAEQALSFRIRMDGDAYDSGAPIRSFAIDLAERLGALPGVRAVGASSVLPLSGRGGLINFAVVGSPPPPENVNREIGIASVTPGYFDAIGAPLRRGRDVALQDHNEAPRVTLINEAAERFWFPGEDALGRRIVMGSNEWEIVGIVSDVVQGRPGDAAAPSAYVPHQQSTTRTLRMVVRTAADPIALAPLIRNTVRAADPGLPVSDFAPLTDVFSKSLARPRFYTALLTLFAGIALALAAVGIFGVISYSVAQRTREIGIRMALGARASSVITAIVARALAIAGVGLLLGIGGALVMGRVLSSQLYGVSPTDPIAFAAVAVVLLGVSLIASWLPARRAASVDPARTLRDG